MVGVDDAEVVERLAPLAGGHKPGDELVVVVDVRHLLRRAIRLHLTVGAVGGEELGSGKVAAKAEHGQRRVSVILVA